MYPTRRLQRLRRLAAASVAALVLSGCASMQASSFIEPGADFTRYRTYAWSPADRLFTGDPRLDNNPFFQARLQTAVETQLAARGLGKTLATPDLLLHYHASIAQAFDVSGVDREYGYCDDCEPYVFEKGTLTLDVVDARTNRLVWRGWAQGSMEGAIDNQDWMERRIDEAVVRIVQRFPRQQASR